ncbi:hypothetical protein DPMN_126029 [Dreissena polymorpha]|uniref:C2H2-type domain-containing protein n=1 Tax=Dreissena polymorpha TaxID=45954 RepID=A0A9D4GWC2_DREPO|nr:hypothetical protein DPMN_126029 [Dreissena polymorpha]
MNIYYGQISYRMKFTVYHHFSGNFVCNICNVQVTSQEITVYHHFSGNFVCNICNVRVTSVYHHFSGNFVCNICNVRVSSQEITVYHHFSGNFVCNICNVRVTSQEILDIHVAGQKHKSRAARDKIKGTENKIVPEGGLIVEGRNMLRPGKGSTCPGF